jgi:hypothetical protein
MHISIWQQFGSNHSNGFTIVGEFETVEEARQTANRFLTMLEEIRSEQETWTYPFTNLPKEVEKKYSALYDVNWPEILDWLLSEGNIHDYVIAYENRVIVDSLGEAKDYKPIDVLMAQWAKRMLLETEMGLNAIVVEITCQIPDPQQGQILFDTLNAYFKEANLYEYTDDPITPWRSLAKPVTLTFEHKDRPPTIYSTDEDTVWYGEVQLDTTEQTAQLRITNLIFNAVGHGLPPLLAYLKANGCTDIQYSLSERPRSEIYEDF